MHWTFGYPSMMLVECKLMPKSRGDMFNKLLPGVVMCWENMNIGLGLLIAKTKLLCLKILGQAFIHY